MATAYEMMQATKSEISRFLSPLGKSVNIPEIPFSEKQVDAFRYYQQYAGADAEYIPPGLTLDDLSKLGKIDSSLFSVRHHLHASTTRGGWVLSMYGLLPETIGLARQQVYQRQNALLEKFELKNCFVDFGNILDHLYLKLLFSKRTGQYHLDFNACWTNEFLVDSAGVFYLVLAHTLSSGLYVQMRFTDKSPDVGASPIIYPAHPASRPLE